MRPVARIVLALAAAVVVAGGVYLLREATMSTHYDTGENTRLVVGVRAASNRPEPGLTLKQMATAQSDLCALEVSAARVGELRTVDGTRDRFLITLRPSLDSTDRKQYRGCLEDWAADHLLLHVESMTDVEPGGGGSGT